MSGTLVVVGAVAFVALVAVFTVIGIRNAIVSGKNRVKRAWADVIVWERKKLKVIPELERGLKEYQEYEKDVLHVLTGLRSHVAALSSENIDVKKLQKTELLSKVALTGLRVAVEAYPDLKAADLTAGWMKELSEAEENIAAAISVFNETVEDFNNGIQLFPGNVVNGWFNNETALATFSDSDAESEFEYKPTFSH